MAVMNFIREKRPDQAKKEKDRVRLLETLGDQIRRALKRLHYEGYVFGESSPTECYDYRGGRKAGVSMPASDVVLENSLEVWKCRPVGIHSTMTICSNDCCTIRGHDTVKLYQHHRSMLRFMAFKF